MEPRELLKSVTKEYGRLNVKDGRWEIEDLRYKAPEQLAIPSNQIKALINIIAPLIKK